MTDAGIESKTGLRELTRASVRDQIAEHALRLFDDNGFDATTVSDISRTIGISQRSFFRYFPAKEDVVVGDPRPLGTLVVDAAAARPTDEPVWAVLRRAFDPIESAASTDPLRGLRTMRVMMSTASLRARNVEKHIAWAVMLEPVIVARLDGDEQTRNFRAHTLIHSALACLDVALAEWASRGGATPIGELLDDAFGALRG
jgi:AcrR family transcriptional regulator